MPRARAIRQVPLTVSCQLAGTSYLTIPEAYANVCTAITCIFRIKHYPPSSKPATACIYALPTEDFATVPCKPVQTKLAQTWRMNFKNGM